MSVRFENTETVLAVTRESCVKKNFRLFFISFQVEDLDTDAASKVYQAEHQARQEGWSGNLAGVLFKERAEEKEEEAEAKELEKLQAEEGELRKQMEEEKQKEIDKGKEKREREKREEEREMR